MVTQRIAVRLRGPRAEASAQRLIASLPLHDPQIVSHTQDEFVCEVTVHEESAYRGCLAVCGLLAGAHVSFDSVAPSRSGSDGPVG